MESGEGSGRGRKEREEVKVKLKTLKAVMEQCRRALESINADGLYEDDDDDDDDDNNNDDDDDDSKLAHQREDSSGSSSSSPDHEAEELCGLIKSRLEGPEFLHKIESMSMMSAQQNHQVEEGSSWDMVNDNDLWEGGNVEDDDQEYVVVRQEDIVDGIANFMATYLLSLEKTKDLTPNKLQEALSKTFSLKKKKGKLRKAFDGTKIIYNVASWSATAIGIYQNPALLRAATTAFWTSCRVLSRLF